MESKEDAEYRLRLAEGFLKEAENFYRLSIWRASVGSSQLSVENSAKAVMSLFRPVVRAHDLAEALLDLEEYMNTEEEREALERLAECTRLLGLREHILVDYGDEVTHTTPWEIYNEERARRSLKIAEKAFNIASEILGRFK